MPYFKDAKNQLYFLDEGIDPVKWLPVDCVVITNDEAKILQAPPVPTQAQLHDIAKRERDQAVSNIIVTTKSGKSFDGDEASQGRMSRSIIGMDDTDVMQWKLADNTITSVDKAELREALRLSGAAQSVLWFIP